MNPPDPSLDALLRRSVAELKGLFFESDRPLPRGLVDALGQDPRSAARELGRRLRDRERGNRSEGQRLRHLLRFEIELWRGGYEYVCGVDEAGMAPLAGPVVAGAVILRRNYKLRGLDDSKKVLDEGKRDRLAARIKEDAVSWAVGQAEPQEIDQINIYHAGLLAMSRAIAAIGVSPQFLLVDGRILPRCPCPQRRIFHGDALSASIAAASLVAKTTRDALMRRLDALYPAYGFASHKGYPTPEHRRRIEEHGVTPVHRRSFAIVRHALGLPLFPHPEPPVEPPRGVLPDDAQAPSVREDPGPVAKPPAT